MFFSKAKAPAPVTATAPVHERRRSIRHAAVMQLAKLKLDCGREELCLLRDVSPDGLRAEVYCTVRPGDRIVIELRTGHSLSGAVCWADGSMIGVSFDEPVPMSAMLAHCSFDDRLGKLRPPRLVVDLRGRLRVGLEETDVAIGNISQAGMQIAAPEPLAPGAPCAIALPGLPPRAAGIRWWRDGQAGLLLAQPFDYAEFAAWRAALAMHA